MRLKTLENTGFKVWVSANETYTWANRQGNSWPCSQLAGKRLFAEFDANGLCDLAVNGKEMDLWEGELLALLGDLVPPKLPAGHYWKGLP